MVTDISRGQKVPLTNKYNGISVMTDSDVSADKTNYQEIYRNIIHAVVYTRPDCAFAISKHRQYMSNPIQRHI